MMLACLVFVVEYAKIIVWSCYKMRIFKKCASTDFVITTITRKAFNDRINSLNIYHES